jgi:hypothetical protein
MTDARATAMWAASAALLGLAFTAAIAWAASRGVPRFVHQTLTNRLLGILPALLIGLVMVALGLALIDRIALEPATQELIRRGVLTGPLVAVVDVLEQIIAGVR